MLVIVSYDVSDDKRRTRLHKLLKGFGVAVQRSVFACDVRSAAYDLLRVKAGREIEASDDSVHFYPLCSHCQAAAQRMGSGPTGEQPNLLIL